MSRPDPVPAPEWRSILTSAVRYWEPRRLIYNAVLGVIVLLHWLDAQTASEVNYTHGPVLWLFLLAVAANICYCAAYGVDLLLQFSDFRQTWLRWRWALLVPGILVAAAATHIVCGPFFRIPV